MGAMEIHLSLGLFPAYGAPKNGSLKPCGDFWRLNLVRESDVYPMSNMLDFSNRLSGCRVFSKMDIGRATGRSLFGQRTGRKQLSSLPLSSSSSKGCHLVF
jgi:hypothetical protein